MAYLILTFFLISCFLATIIYVGYHIHLAGLAVQTDKEKATNEMSYWRGYAESSDKYASAIAVQNQKLHELIIGNYTPQMQTLNASPPPRQLTENPQIHTSDASDGREVAEMTQPKVDKTHLERRLQIPSTINNMYEISQQIGLVIAERRKDGNTYWADIPSVFDTKYNKFVGEENKEIDLWISSCQNDNCANPFLTQRADKKFCSDRCRK
jgi:hypothetical protein